ncbi:MAG: Spermidine/putrescine import ATP-binding protein PotA [Subtercola sp.]|nr:Spermidine/putrescine import ATP-binding protein PotA [Subtercola sp.]
MSGVSLARLSKRYSGAASAAVQSLDLDIAPGEFVTLLGPSGCGKTTTLRMIAGLEVPTGGEISINDRLVFSKERSVFVPPEKRGIGMVFQSYALWPHMSVKSTVGYPLKLAKTPKPERDRRIAEMLDRVHLADRADDAAVALSGGQQQRVALARAMAGGSSLVLFDEPLSNLDVKLRYAMRVQIRELHDELGTTSVYVTHDQEEAIALADRVVVMNIGRIEQIGTAQQVYTKPINAFVADFMGFQNILPATVVTVGGATATVELNGIGARIDVINDRMLHQGDALLVAFRASHVELELSDTPAPGSIPGFIHTVTYLGSTLRVLINVKGGVIRAQVDERDFGRYGPDDFAQGHPVNITLSPGQILSLPAPGQKVHTEPERLTSLVSTMQ